MSTTFLKNVSIFGTSIKTTDVDQGELGDCYFLSACSSLAEKPERFTQSILTDNVNSAGLFAMNAYVRGIPSTMISDDYIPFNIWSSSSAAPVFS
jgi:calpain-15